MEKIDMTKEQYNTCQNFLNNKIDKNEIYMLFKTYLNEYIQIFGYDSWQNDPINTILNNFCNASAY
jgi:hypothetical protein